MDMFFEKLTEYLINEKMLCFDLNKWNQFQIRHIEPINDEMAKTINYIKEKVGNNSGIYIYQKNDEIIYIGKAKNLVDRLKSHYIESFRTVSGDTKSNKWHRFFEEYCGLLTVYWLTVEDETARQIIEIILTEKFRPKFLSFGELQK